MDTNEDDFWIPLVDEPIGTVVAEIQSEDPEIEQLVDSPRKLLAFRTFAYIRVGILLGSLLVERDVDSDAAASWAERLRPLLDEGVRVYCYFKHEDEPTAPAYAERLSALLGNR